MTALICDRRQRQKVENRSLALLYMRDLQRDLSQDHRWSIFKSPSRYSYPVRFHENTTLKGDVASNHRNGEVKDANMADNVFYCLFLKYDRKPSITVKDSKFTRKTWKKQNFPFFHLFPILQAPQLLENFIFYGILLQ